MGTDTLIEMSSLIIYEQKEKKSNNMSPAAI